VGRDLLVRIGQAVKGLEALFAQDAILDRHDAGNKDIVELKEIEKQK
jgi:hypothetical protein